MSQVIPCCWYKIMHLTGPHAGERELRRGSIVGTVNIDGITHVVLLDEETGKPLQVLWVDIWGIGGGRQPPETWFDFVNEADKDWLRKADQ